MIESNRREDVASARSLVAQLRELDVELWHDGDQLRFRAPAGVMNDERIAAVRACKPEIVELLSSKQAMRLTADPANRHEPFPLTDVQAAYLVGRQDSFGYGNVACHGYIEASYPTFPPNRLEDAWNRLIDRHDMLRAVIEPDGSQRVLPSVERMRIPILDLRGASAEEVEAGLTRMREELDHRIYPIPSWPMFEVRLTLTDAGDIVHFSMDSLIADWASAGVLFDELGLLLAQPGAALPSLQIGFRDYLLAERRVRETSRYQQDRRYWMDRVDHLPSAPELPTKASGSGDTAVRFRRHHATLSPARWTQLKQRATEQGLTSSIVVLAAYAAVLRRWSRQDRFCLSLTLLNRLPLHPQVNQLVGDFTSVSLLAVPAATDRSFSAQAAELGKQLFTDIDHRLFSGIEVLRELARRRGRDAVLIPVVFTSAIGLTAGNPQERRYRLSQGITQTPQVTLDCQVKDDAEGLHVDWDVRQGVFPDGLIDDMFAALCNALERLADRPETWHSGELVPLPGWQLDERRWANDTAAPLPAGSLHGRVMAQATRTPDAMAVIDARRRLTYRQLACRAAAVAEELRRRGLAPEERVAIVMHKGVEQVAAVLGVLLAGGAYLPLDAAQPRLRRDRVLRGAGVRQVLLQSWNDAGAELADGVATIAVDTMQAGTELPADDGNTDPDALAYVIYTSGSAGDPKGVMISHRSALNTIDDMNQRFGVTAADRVLGLAQLSFDLSVYDIFGTLSLGATLVLPDPDRRNDPSHWAALIAERGITLWNSVPAQLQMLGHRLDAEPVALPSLRMAWLSGDWIPLALPDQIRRHVPHIELIGLGGATEASIWSNYHRITELDKAWSSIPYGLPLANQGFRVLDSALRDAPVGVAGELFITGAGLAKGYLGDEDLTRARFFAHPVDGQRLYRTGDLARYLPGGELEFLGREDGQVKIRGYRIELGEIEAALTAHPAVGAAAAVAAGTTSTDRALLAFVEAAPTDVGTVEPQDMRLETAMQRYAGDAVHGTAAERVCEHMRSLHHAARASMFQAFVEKGLFTTTAARHTACQVLDAMETHDRHRWLVRRWLAQLVDNGWLAVDPSTGLYRRLARIDLETVAAEWQAVRDGVGDGLCTRAFIDYHETSVKHLQTLIQGVQNPFDLLFPEGRHDVAHAIYRDDAAARYNNHAAAALIHRLAADNETGEPLRVIELGGGTGATTSVVAPLLDGHDVDYLFTDLTPFFMQDARESFRDFPWMRFGAFDLNADARAQGLLPCSADIVLCAGVLSSTRDVDAALDAAIGLLAPGGWLVLTEPTQEHPHILLTQGFMMDPAAGDHDLGKTKFGGIEQWQRRLQARGGRQLIRLPQLGHPMDAFGMHVLAAQFKVDRRAVSPVALKDFLALRLPSYMVPMHLQVVDRLPLTANGKIDRKTLAAWRPATAVHGAPARAAAANDELEQRLCALWSDALGVDQVARDDNVYDLGADSLILARVAGRLREELPEAAAFAYDTLLRHMLNEPTISTLAHMLRSSPDAVADSAPATAEPAATQGAKRQAQSREGSNALIIPFGDDSPGPLRVLFHAALGTMDYFQHLGRTLAAQQLGSVVGIAVADVERYLEIEPRRLIERVADDYAQRLLDDGHTRFQLIGYCLGGLLAAEVARRLMERGAEVQDLTLIDSIPMFIETDEELAFEAIFVPNLNLDPVKAVFGEGLPSDDVYRAIDKLVADFDRKVPAGAMGELSGDPGLEAVAAAVRLRSRIPQADRLAAYAHAAASQAGVPIGPELVPALFRVCRHSMRAARFDPPPYVGNMTYLRCLEQQSFGITAGVGHLAAPFWERTCLGEFSLIDVPGNHFSVIEPPHVHLVAEHLANPLHRCR